jgi:translation elongation factor EF-Ts
MHVAAINPQFVSADDVPAEQVAGNAGSTAQVA